MKFTSVTVFAFIGANTMSIANGAPVVNNGDENGAVEVANIGDPIINSSLKIASLPTGPFPTPGLASKGPRKGPCGQACFTKTTTGENFADNTEPVQMNPPDLTRLNRPIKFTVTPTFHPTPRPFLGWPLGPPSAGSVNRAAATTLATSVVTGAANSSIAVGTGGGGDPIVDIVTETVSCTVNDNGLEICIYPAMKMMTTAPPTTTPTMPLPYTKTISCGFGTGHFADMCLVSIFEPSTPRDTRTKPWPRITHTHTSTVSCDKGISGTCPVHVETVVHTMSPWRPSQTTTAASTEAKSTGVISPIVDENEDKKARMGIPGLMG